MPEDNSRKLIQKICFKKEFYNVVYDTFEDESRKEFIEKIDLQNLS